jgi:UPF0716 protein FxsA
MAAAQAAGLACHLENVGATGQMCRVRRHIMPFLWVLALWPVVEIGLFVLIGGRIGLLATFAVILATGALGVWVFRGLGRGKGPVSGMAAADHVLRALAALLLILPGFLTDMAGLILLIPVLRRGLIALGVARIAMRFGPLRQAANQGGFGAQSDVVDAEFIDITPPRLDK